MVDICYVNRFVVQKRHIDILINNIRPVGQKGVLVLQGSVDFDLWDCEFHGESLSATTRSMLLSRFAGAQRLCNFAVAVKRQRRGFRLRGSPQR